MKKNDVFHKTDGKGRLVEPTTPSQKLYDVIWDKEKDSSPVQSFYEKVFNKNMSMRERDYVVEDVFTGKSRFPDKEKVDQINKALEELANTDLTRLSPKELDKAMDFLDPSKNEDMANFLSPRTGARIAQKINRVATNLVYISGVTTILGFGAAFAAIVAPAVAAAAVVIGGGTLLTSLATKLSSTVIAQHNIDNATSFKENVSEQTVYQRMGYVHNLYNAVAQVAQDNQMLSKINEINQTPDGPAKLAQIRGLRHKFGICASKRDPVAETSSALTNLLAFRALTHSF